jgi:hypothetical protein
MKSKYIRNIVRRMAAKIHRVPSLNKMARMSVSVAKWKGNVLSPVMLMIDDLSNAFVVDKTKNNVDARGDWGGLHDHPKSIYRFLENNLFNVFPEIRTTFFLVVGSISQYNKYEAFNFSKPINHDNASIQFFRHLYKDFRFEIAYHGLNHGISGETSEEFIQEWEGFTSVFNADQQTRNGLELYKKIFGAFPIGGKYGGWKYNRYSEASINNSGFKWWCRDWMPKDISQYIHHSYYEPQFFGKKNVVALPSTVHGNLWTKKQINLLLKDMQIISIEEHIGALRPDGCIQTPNVFDDINRLKKLFGFIRGKNVWHATGTEISEYFITRHNTLISDIGSDSFILNHISPNTPGLITLIVKPQDMGDIATNTKYILTASNGSIVKGYVDKFHKHILFDIISIPGEYRLFSDHE